MDVEIPWYYVEKKFPMPWLIFIPSKGLKIVFCIDHITVSEDLQYVNIHYFLHNEFHLKLAELWFMHGSWKQHKANLV